jgi:hypothetical protein
MTVIPQLVKYIREQPVMPTAVRLSRGLWDAAFEEMGVDPRVRELHGVPPAARIEQANFLLLGIPIICDQKIDSGCVAELRR